MLHENANLSLIVTHSDGMVCMSVFVCLSCIDKMLCTFDSLTAVLTCAVLSVMLDLSFQVAQHVLSSPVTSALHLLKDTSQNFPTRARSVGCSTFPLGIVAFWWQKCLIMFYEYTQKKQKNPPKAVLLTFLCLFDSAEMFEGVSFFSDS